MNKLERKQKRQRRLDLTHHLSMVIQKHCKPCQKRKDAPKNLKMSVCEECPINEEIRVIGHELENGVEEMVVQKVVVEEKIPTPTKPYSDIKLEDYNRLRLKGLSDEKIAETLGFSRSAVYRFKKRNGMVRSKNETVEDRVQKTVDTYFTNHKSVSDELKSSAHTQHVNEIESLKDQLLESQSEIHRLSNLNESLKTQNTRLREHENDYRDLEVQFKNLEYKVKSLAAENEDLKEVAVLNQLLMRQHVKFVDRQAPKEIEVNNQWR